MYAFNLFTLIWCQHWGNCYFISLITKQHVENKAKINIGAHVVSAESNHFYTTEAIAASYDFLLVTKHLLMTFF